MRFAPYPRYKPSGVEWLGEVPEHWDVKRGRFCMDVNPSSRRMRTLRPEDEVSFVPMEAVGEYGGLELGQSRAIADIGSGYTEFEDGDVVVAKITPCFENGKGAMAAGLLNGAAFGTTELHVLRAAPILERRFLFYFSISRLFRSTGEGEMYGAGGQKRVPPEFCENVRVPLPPIDDQRAIADFLDRETAKIDTLLAKKRTLIERLKEKRTALISRTVTRGLPPRAARAAGLDPHPKLKPSGIDWLGDVPEHWTVARVSHRFRNLDARRIPLAGEDRSILEKIYPYYGASGIIDYVDDYIFDEPLILVAEDGANLLSRSTPLAFIASGKYWVNNHAHILKPIDGDIRYWVGVLQTFDFTPLISGAAQPKLTSDRLGSVPVPSPPPLEQRAIGDFLDRETSKIDSMVATVETAIERLLEYRTALITAAVTGKIDVGRQTNGD
jgi:type I restriction enzyme S subunit